MPDVGRSDSQRSDSSQRPRVSFNRDVHVKRIGHAGGPRVVGALAGDGDGHLVPLPVRRERPSKLSRRELAEEARRVLQQADSVTCTSRGAPLGFSTLPPLRSRKNPRRSLSFREKKVNLSRSASDASNKLSTSSLERRKKSDNKQQNDATSNLSINSLERRKKPNKPQSDASNNFINSLERRKKPNKTHSDYSDKSPVRPRRNILKKSHSDSETAPVIELQPKKQLSPIIEASPREDYFEPMLHSSQAPASKPPLSKGRTVDAMVKRLSQDKIPRRPPRGVNPSALVSPGDGRQHNSNQPFSYTEPTQQVIYAEVVVSGGGPKQTVHTIVPQSHSDDDEGLGLTMESTRGRADGMDSRRKELITEGYFQPHVGDGFDSYKTDDYFGKEKSHIEDSFNSYKTEYHSKSRVIKDIGDGFDSYKKEYRSEARLFKDDQRSPLGEYRSIKEPPIQPRIITNNDLSSRRDRLESRIESQRKDRFMNSRKFEVNYNNRQDFLQSQLNSEDSLGKKEVFADSGIEVDSPKERPTAKIIISTPKVAQSDLPSDGDETDGGHFSYSKAQLSSTRLVQEQRRVADTVPTSTVLIRHYTDEPQTDEDYEAPPSPREEKEQPRRKEKLVRQEETKKPPKKKQVSTMEKVKQLFTRNSTNKKKKKKEPEEDLVAARYTEYKGSAIESDQETLTPLSEQHSPVPHRRHDHTPSPSPPLRYRRERTPSPPPSSRYHRDRSPSPPPSSRYHRDRTPSPPHHRQERSPSPLSRHRREASPVPPRHQREDSPPSSRHYKDRVPSPRYHRERSPSPPPSRHRRDHSPPSRYQSREPSPHTLRRHQHSPTPRQQLLQVPLNDHPSSRHHHRWMASDTEEHKKTESVRTRERLATPTPSPSPRRATSSATLTRINNSKNKEKDNSSGGWFKSLDRLTRKNKPKGLEKEPENEKPSHKQASENGKNLRFFGDTDQESVTSIPPPMPLQTHRRYKSNSNMTSSSKAQAPRSNPQLKNHRRHHHSAGDVATSSAESTTEGDSSQQSQRSVVYLHAATVGDIPTPAKRAVARRTQSREELSSVTSSHLQPQTRTVSRSISVLAPWKPRHPREALEVHYDKEDNNKNYVKNGRPPKVPVSQQTSLNSSTMNRINRRKNAENNKQRVSRAASTESLKGREKLHPSKSIESLSHKKSSSKVSRSASMPKDNRVTSGWFRLRNKKQGT